MKRTTIVIFAGLTMAVGIAAFATEVTAPDGTVIPNVLTAAAEDGTTWARVDLGAPVAIKPNADGKMQLPHMTVAGYLIQDQISREPIDGGSLNWLVPGAPKTLTQTDWKSSGGTLDISCLGGERVEFSAPGYASTSVRLVTDGRRHTVLMQPQATVDFLFKPMLPRPCRNSVK